jgi:hypothetical protein
MNTQKLLVIGHGRHGKDTVCEILRDNYGLQFISSSHFVCNKVIWDDWGVWNYTDKTLCYADRGNHRPLWANMISKYNTPDKSRTATEMLAAGYDIYCGMRMRDELEASRHLFDKVVWVDRSLRLPAEPSSSMELNEQDATHILDNNGALQDLKHSVAKLMALGAEMSEDFKCAW